MFELGYESDKKNLKRLIANERSNYKRLIHGKNLDLVWELNATLKSRCYISFNYQRADGLKSTRTVEPVGVLFSEYYFYLAAHIEGKGYEYPTIFRVDRIEDVQMLGRKPKEIKRSDSDRFQDGIYRQQIAFMQSGELMQVRLRLKKWLKEVVYDKLPNAEILNENEEFVTIQVKVFGKGVQMWLLSQGAAIEVIRPESLRKSMRSSINEMKKMYE
ncbi:WYL domain-containing protein [Shouchella sp. 1P09AA]|uniref:helix-turn-helix transcriptional regulator n=1 Tax=unclassified Shouchella TaxID=2893065 RepID=UPI00399F3ED5